MATVSDPVSPAAAPVNDHDAALRIGRNFSFRIAAQVFSALVNVAAMVMLGNTLPAGDYGAYAFYYALIALVASIADGGVGLITTREIARHRIDGPRLLGDALLVKGAVSLLLLAVVAAGAFAFLPRPQAVLVTLVTATGLLDFSQDPTVWTLRAYERLNLEAVLLIVSQVVWFGVLALALFAHTGLAGLLAAATVAYAIRLIVGLAVLSRGVCRARFHVDPARLKALVREGLPFGLAMFGVVLYGRIGLLVLKALSTRTDVAYYHVSYMLSQPFGFVASALGVAAFPVLSRNARRGESALRGALRRTTRVQLLITPPLTVGLFLLAHPIITDLFRKGQLGPAANGLRVMSLAIPLIFLNLTSRYALTAMDRQSDYLRGVIAGLIASVATGVALIPSLGYIGACVAAIAGELTIWFVCQRTLGRFVGVRRLLTELWKPAVAALGMGLVVFVLRGANVVLLSAIGCVTYAALLLLLRGLTAEELAMIGRLYSSMGLPGRKAPARPELRF
jgi:O-antigen/teichoic acid export membrane protein